MTAMTDAISVITILKGTTATNAELLRIADRFIAYAGSAFQPADPANPTNEEKAQLFLTMMRTMARSVIQRQAEITQNISNAGSVQTAIDTALADF